MLALLPLAGIASKREFHGASAPAVVSGNRLDPIGAITHQEEMLCLAETQVALACQERSFAEVLGGFRADIMHSFQEAVAAMVGGRGSREGMTPWVKTGCCWRSSNTRATPMCWSHQYRLR